MFELLVLLVVGAVVVGALLLVLSAVKFILAVALLPLKILFYPLAAVVAVVLGAAFLAVLVTVIVPIIVVVALVAVPAAVIAALA